MRPQLVLADPGGIAHILQKRIYDYREHPPRPSPHVLLTLTETRADHSAVVRPRVARLLGRGLGWVEGEAAHKRMRHLVAPALACVHFFTASLSKRGFD